jgi:hypothetical protein
MRNFPWEATVLYLGKYVWSTKLPWHYTPVWIGVSTPLAYVIFFAVGLVACGYCLVRAGERGRGRGPLARRDVVVILAWFFLPLSYFMTSRAVLYDEWRHSFFIYPAFLVVGLAGLVWLWNLAGVAGSARRPLVGTVRAALVTAVVLGLGSTAAFMVRHHPFENVFFNSLVGGVKGAGGKFEMDYWGTSYRKGLERIVANDPSPGIPVFAATAPGRYNADILRPADRQRLNFVTELDKAKYYITNFRWESRKMPPHSEVYSVKVDGVKLLAVYRL